MYRLYSYKKKKPYGIIITVLVAIIILSLTAFITYNKLTKQTHTSEFETVDNTVSKEIPPPVIYSKNTSFFLTKSYICGHEYKTDSQIPEDFIGKTIDEIYSLQYKYEIVQYDNHSITAIEYIESECDSHYIIKLQGKTLVSYNKKTPHEIIKQADINLYEYYEEDIKILNNGIEVASMNELLEFFEDFA